MTEYETAFVRQWAYAFNKPDVHGTIKASEDDFVVVEQLGFEPSQQGEHLYLFIEKRGLNTEQVLLALTKALNVTKRQVSYSGLKDRQARTQQWFSVHLPGLYPEGCDTLAGDGWRVLRAERHHKKLHVGTHKANFFTITVRDLNNSDSIATRIAAILQRGVPNYFGEQRFGHLRQNLYQGWRFLQGEKKVKDPFLRGVYYSSLRSYVFNSLLAARVEADCWDSPLPGDVMMLQGTHSFFVEPELNPSLLGRIADWDISPSGPLIGKGSLREQTNAAKFVEDQLRDPVLTALVDKLQSARIELMYRPYRLAVSDIQYCLLDKNTAEFRFSLPRGAFATSVLREIFQEDVAGLLS